MEEKARIERINKALCDLLRRLTSGWMGIDISQAERWDKTALHLLCWAGMAELHLRGRAWTDQTALDFEATVCGVWTDGMHKSVLNDEIRRVVPAWAGKAVALALQPDWQARLTAHGAQAKLKMSAGEDSSFFEFHVCGEFKPGRVGVQTLGNEGPAPGAVRQDTIVGVGEMLAVLQRMAGSLKSIAGDTSRMAESQATQLSKNIEDLHSRMGAKPATDDWLHEYRPYTVRELAVVTGIDKSSLQEKWQKLEHLGKPICKKSNGQLYWLTVWLEAHRRKN